MRISEGFELDSLHPELVAYGSGGFNSSGSVAGADGSYIYQIGAASAAYVYHTFDSAEDEVFTSARLLQSEWTAQNGLQFYKDSAGTTILTIRLYGTYPSKVVSVRLGGYTGTEIVSCAYDNGSNHVWEVKYKPLNSGGEVKIKIDGVLVIDYSGDTTAGLENIGSVFFGSQSEQVGCKWDNIIIDTSDWIGMPKIQKLQISGAGSKTEWTPSTGTNYDAVLEIPYSDTDYNTASGENLIDSFACADLTGTPKEIKNLDLAGRFKYSGLYATQAIVVKTGGVEYSGEIAPGSSFSARGFSWVTNPNTSVAWTSGEVNSLEIGYKLMPI